MLRAQAATREYFMMTETLVLDGGVGEDGFGNGR
jgi:hypothetical protein